MYMLAFCGICFTLTFRVKATSEHNSSREMMILEDVLKGYDPRVGPFVYSGKPTVVKMGIFILEMTNFNDLNMEYTLIIFLRRSWYDPRLSFANLTSDQSPIYAREINSIWMPDIYFVNERDSKLHVTTLPNSSTRINADGTIWMSSKYSVTFACPMDMRDFPLDSQKCKVEIESWSYPLSMVQFEWFEENALEMPADLILTQFTLDGTDLQHCNNVYSTGGYACLRILFTFGRKYTYHLLATYIPSAFIVVVSWISFWISPDAVPGRVTLGVTTVLTMTTQTFISGLSLPQVPYVKAIDVWMTVSMIFVFAALIEYAIVNVAQRRSNRVALHKDKATQMSTVEHKEYEIKEYDMSTEKIEREISRELPSNKKQVYQRDREIYSKNGCSRWESDKIDGISKYLFPVLYIIFVVTYWIFYSIWAPQKFA